MIDKNEYNKEWMRKYRKTEKGKIANSKSCEKWRNENPEYGEYQKLWRKDNPEYMKRWNKNNPENEKKRKEIYRKENPEEVIKSRKKYNKTEKGEATNQRRHITRQAREKDIINTLTAEEWINILKEYKFRCAYCGKEFTLFNRATRDHVIPISKGGNNNKENIVPACQSCNSRKGVKILPKVR